MKTRVIVNPMANKGNCGKRWPQIRAELESHLGPLAADDVVTTREPSHGTALAREAVTAGYRRLIAVGGDGTFSEVLNGVIANDQLIAPDLVLAQLPGGTSNEFSRSFGQTALAVRRKTGNETAPVQASSFGRIVGESAQMRALYTVFETLAQKRTPLAIRGERGTGKRLLAEELHAHGPWKDGPFVVVPRRAPIEPFFPLAQGGTIVD